MAQHTLTEWQAEVDAWAQQFEVPYWQPLEMMARITEETGELARELNHLYGAKKKKAVETQDSLGGEIADLMFALICLANREGVNLDENLSRVMEKYNIRDANRFAKKGHA